MSLSQDKIRCRDLHYTCEIGFHRNEKGIKQKISIDYEVTVNPIPANQKDDVAAIKLDYFEANQMIEKLLEENHFKLIETVAEEVAKLLLNLFPIESARVSVTKYPLDPPDGHTVTYECLRQR